MPDHATRYFLHHLRSQAEFNSIPFFALVDADPFGVGIFTNYKYGSINQSKQSRTIERECALNNLQLCGVTIKQIRHQNLLEINQMITLTDSDKKKCNNLLQLSNYLNDEALKQIMQSQQEWNVKAEIETLMSKGVEWFVKTFLPQQISAMIFENSKPKSAP